MQKRGPIDNWKIMLVLLLVMAAVATLYFAGLEGEKGKVV